MSAIIEETITKPMMPRPIDTIRSAIRTRNSKTVPANGTVLLFLVLIADRMVSMGLGIMGFVIVSSMIADIVEDIEVKSGQRSEGLLFSADTVLQKIAQGLAIM